MKLSRRKRQLVFTSVSVSLFIVITSIVVWSGSTSNEVYRPGESIQGLTSNLSRSLPPDYPDVKFVDVTEEAGITFQHFNGRRTSQLPEDMGSGAAWGDYDNDGWLDLYIVNMAGPLTLNDTLVATSPASCKLYRNDGDGTFTDVSERTGVGFRGWGMGAAWGDHDNDGWIDLLVTAYGTIVFYRNNGDGTFTDRSHRSGLGVTDGFWSTPAWGDYDRDGWIDVYVPGYVRYRAVERADVSLHYDAEVPANINPSSFDPERNLLFHNNGDGTFSEVAEPAGVSNPGGRSLAASWADFNDDGWDDLYVANDVSDNVMYRNLGDGTFEDISHRALVADYRGAMGIAVGDWDGDEDLDMFVTHWLAQENALYTNMFKEGVGLRMPSLNTFQFMDVADRFGLGQIALDYVGWGTSFFDYDNDGRLDLFVVNGSTLQRKDQPHLLVPMEKQLFWNGGTETGFFDVSSVAGSPLDRRMVGRGAATADYDNDGDLDLIVVNNGGPAELLRNEGGNDRRWLKVSLSGSEGNSQGLGTRLRLVVGEHVQIRQAGSEGSYGSQHGQVVHFGVGRAMLVDTLGIQWPSGVRQVLTHIETNQVIEIIEDRPPS